MDPCKFCCSGLYTDPCKVDTSCGIWFQAITALSEQNIARLGCLHESVPPVQFHRLHGSGVYTSPYGDRTEPCGSKSWPAFFRSQTCTLSRSKIRPVSPVPCKRKAELCKFLSVQRFVRTRVNGASEANNLTVQFEWCKFTIGDRMVR